MDYGMISKIEKAKFYAQEPERVTFNTLSVEFKGDNDSYRITLGPDGWDCTCSGYRTHGICPHVMTLEKLFRPMLKRSPLPYAPGQNVVSDVEKAKKYADEPDRIHVEAFEATFKGENTDHLISYQNGEWHCDCTFFATRGVCVHSMTLERLLKGMISPAPIEMN